MAWLAFGIGEAAVKQSRRFIPYWVRVSPNWYQILTDFRLVGSPEEWRSIAESVRSSADYHVLQDGVLFTVVQQSEDFERTLIFWNQHQAFGSEFSFGEDMTPIQFVRTTDPSGRHPPAIFFMKPWGTQGVAGYSLGIEVEAWWWEKLKDSCGSPLAVETNPLTGSVDLILATLPVSEFDIYRNPANRWTDEYILKTEPKIRKQRDDVRQKLAWTAKDLRIPELPCRVPQHIEHRYFVVEHREI
jgi:hypothetical protein